MTDRTEYLKALSEAPGRPLSDDCHIPGLGSGEFALAALWSVQAETEKMLGREGIEESRQLAQQFIAEQPWRD